MRKEMKSSKAKKIKVIMMSVFAVVLLLCLSTFLFVRSYIHKMNIVILAESSNMEELIEPEPDLEDITSDEPDSPVEEITSVEDEIQTNMEENSTQIISDKDVFNVLLIGSDSREVSGSGRSDAMIIVSINKKKKTITATSLLRDIYLQIPGKSNNRINVAYAYGGAKLLIETIEQNFKIEIDRYASIDFYAFMDIVDAVGGVTLEVTEKEIPIINGYVKDLNKLTEQEINSDILVDSGTLLLSGKQALGYARNRYIGTDFERTARQRRVLEQVFHNVKDLGLTELNHLLNVMLPQITTNLTEGEIFSMILSLPSFAGYDLDQWSVPVKDSYSFLRIRGMDVIGIDFTENINEIHDRIYGGP